MDFTKPTAPHSRFLWVYAFINIIETLKYNHLRRILDEHKVEILYTFMIVTDQPQKTNNYL